MLRYTYVGLHGAAGRLNDTTAHATALCLSMACRSRPCGSTDALTTPLFVSSLLVLVRGLEYHVAWIGMEWTRWLQRKR